MVKQWWENLSERDKRIASIGGIVLALYLIYQFIIAPFSHAIRDEKAALSDKRDTLTFMQNVLSHTPPGDTTTSISHTELLSILSKSLQKTSFHHYTYQLSQTSTDDIELNYATVPFTDFMQWLKKISTKYTVNIKRLSINKTNTPGVVKLSLVIGSA